MTGPEEYKHVTEWLLDLSLKRLSAICHAKKSERGLPSIGSSHGVKILCKMRSHAGENEAFQLRTRQLWGMWVRPSWTFYPQLLCELPSQGQMEQKSRPADPSWPGGFCNLISHCFKFEVACYSVIHHGNNNTSEYIGMVFIFLKSPFTSTIPYSHTMQ